MSSGRRVGKYELYEPFAHGGMASVHYGTEALADGTSLIVAIKRVETIAETSEQLATALVTEARIAKYVRHPNVTGAIDLVVAEREVLFVMEYVDGPSLATLARRMRAKGEPFPLPILLAIAIDVLHGLAALHRAVDENGRALGLVHRDVTPQNVLVVTDGRAKIADFGIAKGELTRPKTVTGEIKGKIRYLAPEQVHGKATPRSDLFSLAVTLWEVLVGDDLFAGANDAEILSRILVEPIRPPSERGVAIPAAVEGVLMRALARDPERRFADATSIVEALVATNVVVASAAEVARVVADCCAGEIAARATRVAEILSEKDAKGEAPQNEDMPVQPAVPAAETARPPAVAAANALRRRRWFSVVVAFSAVIILFVVALRRQGSRADEAMTRVPPSPAPSAAVPSNESDGGAAATAEPGSPTAAPANVAPGSPTAPRGARPARRTEKPDCRTPYYLDPDGRKRFRAECF